MWQLIYDPSEWQIEEIKVNKPWYSILLEIDILTLVLVCLGVILSLLLIGSGLMVLVWNALEELKLQGWL
jgi:hypothetical protein